MNIQSTVMSEGFALNVSIRGNGRPILVVGSSIYYPRLFSEQLYTSFQLIFLDHRGFVKPLVHWSRKNTRWIRFWMISKRQDKRWNWRIL